MKGELMPKTLPRPRDYPMSVATVLAVADRLDAESRTKQKQASELRSVVGKVGCRCGGALTIPLRKNGVYNVDAAYVNH